MQGKISREDVADLCVTLLDAPSATGVTFEVKSTIPFSQVWEAPSAGAAVDWRAELAVAGLRPRVTGKTVGGVYTGKEEEPSEAAGAAAAQPAAAVAR
jgi:hypothetical protein